MCLIGKIARERIESNFKEGTENIHTVPSSSPLNRKLPLKKQSKQNHSNKTRQNKHKHKHKQKQKHTHTKKKKTKNKKQKTKNKNKKREKWDWEVYYRDGLGSRKVSFWEKRKKRKELKET